MRRSLASELKPALGIAIHVKSHSLPASVSASVEQRSSPWGGSGLCLAQRQAFPRSGTPFPAQSQLKRQSTLCGLATQQTTAQACTVSLTSSVEE